jgi:hypothetical protein
MAKRFKPMDIETSNPKTVFDDYTREISMKIIEAIDYGLKHNRKRVAFANLIIDGVLCIRLSVDKNEYLNTLDQNIDNLIPYEEYESCALAVKLKEKIVSKTKVHETITN